MYDTRTHTAPDRIVSISQPYIRPIVRGKAKAPVEFGAKLDISMEDGFTRIETISFDPYNESTVLQEAIERFFRRNGCYPKKVLADKIYRNRTNLKYCADNGIKLSGPALGRPKQGTDPKEERKAAYRDSCDRVAVFASESSECSFNNIYFIFPAPYTLQHYGCILASNIRSLLADNGKFELYSEVILASWGDKNDVAAMQTFIDHLAEVGLKCNYRDIEYEELPGFVKGTHCAVLLHNNNIHRYLKLECLF